MKDITLASICISEQDMGRLKPPSIGGRQLGEISLKTLIELQSTMEALTTSVPTPLEIPVPSYEED